MKKKIAMRVASLALSVVFTVTLIGAPKAKAVAIEAAAIAAGVAVLSTYIATTNMGLIADTAETLSSGVQSLVSDWVEASGVADSADEWLAQLGEGSSITTPGVLLIQGAFARSCATFVDWLTETFGLDEDGKEAVAVPGTADFCSYNELVVPNIETVWNKDVYPYAFVWFNEDNGIYYLYTCDYSIFVSTSDEKQYFETSFGSFSIQKNINKQFFEFIDGRSSWSLISDGASYNKNGLFGSSPLAWSSYSIRYSDNTVYLPYEDPIPVGDVAGQVGLTRNDGFVNFAKGLVEGADVRAHLPPSITTIQELAADSLQMIVDGVLNPTGELVENPTGEGTEDPAVPDDDVVVPGVTSWLQSLLQGVKAIPDAFTNALTSVFTPSQEAVDSLSAEVDAKLPIIPTLKRFGDTLVDNLEHPEKCADGLGLTTVVDLKKGRGSYLGNTTHNLLDVSWYLEYKSLVDDIIVGFCWLCFLWNCYGALPRIIHGEGSITGAINILKDGDED